MYTIDNVAIAFDIRIFEALCAEEKITWFLSSLNDLRKLLAKKVQPSAEQVLVEIRKIPIDKRLKYKSALKYLIF